MESPQKKQKQLPRVTKQDIKNIHSTIKDIEGMQSQMTATMISLKMAQDVLMQDQGSELINRVIKSENEIKDMKKTLNKITEQISTIVQFLNLTNDRVNELEDRLDTPPTPEPSPAAFNPSPDYIPPPASPRIDLIFSPVMPMFPGCDSDPFWGNMEPLSLQSSEICSI